jgi:hypothetical protein
MTYYSKYKVFIVCMPSVGIFISKNGGAGWFNYQIPSAKGYYTASVIKDKIYICTDVGLFVSYF